jgi:hypothetical protein
MELGHCSSSGPLVGNEKHGEGDMGSSGGNEKRGELTTKWLLGDAFQTHWGIMIRKFGHKGPQKATDFAQGVAPQGCNETEHGELIMACPSGLE